MKPEIYVEVLKKYAVFNGRASRTEYWTFFLFNLLISIGLGIIDTAIGSEMQVLGNLYSLVVLIPGLAVATRRLHDTNHSAWWFLINLIPLAGWIWFIVILATKGEEATNKYGAKPIAETPATPVKA